MSSNSKISFCFLRQSFLVCLREDNSSFYSGFVRDSTLILVALLCLAKANQDTNSLFCGNFTKEKKCFNILPRPLFFFVCQRNIYHTHQLLFHNLAIHSFVKLHHNLVFIFWPYWQNQSSSRFQFIQQLVIQKNYQ